MPNDTANNNNNKFSIDNNNNSNNIELNSLNRIRSQNNCIVFKKLTPESINNIRENILNEKTRLEIEKNEASNNEKEKSNNNTIAGSQISDTHQKQRKYVKSLNVNTGDRSIASTASKGPNKDFEAGKILPKKYKNQFPQSLAGCPIEEVDDYYKTDYVNYFILFSL
jgi:hypothetical protein